MGLRDQLRCLRCEVNFREPLCKFCIERVHGAEIALNRLMEKFRDSEGPVDIIVAEMMFDLRNERRR